MQELLSALVAWIDLTAELTWRAAIPSIFLWGLGTVLGLPAQTTYAVAAIPLLLAFLIPLWCAAAVLTISLLGFDLVDRED
jgi:hypothetical protein